MHTFQIHGKTDGQSRGNSQPMGYQIAKTILYKR